MVSESKNEDVITTEIEDEYPPAVDFPAHNTVLCYPNASLHNFEVETHAPDNGNLYYYMKLCAPGTNEAVQAVYIHAGQTANLYVPPGTYEVKWLSGKTWYGDELYFKNRTAQIADETFTFDDSHIWTVTLYPVTDGNLETETIDVEDF